MKKYKIYYKITAVLFAVILVYILWFLGSKSDSSNILVPSIYDTFKSLIDIIKDISTYHKIFSLIIKVILSVIIGFVIGFLSGILSYHFSIYKYFSNGFIVFLRTVPRISILLLIIIVFGNVLTGYASVVLIVIPIVHDIINTGLNDIDKEYLDVFKMENNNFFKYLRFLYIPFLKNNIYLSLLQSISFGIKMMIMSDYLILTKNSIGSSLYWYKANSDYNFVFAWTIIIIIISLIFDLFLKIYIKKTKNNN